MDYNEDNIEQMRLQEAMSKDLYGVDSKLVYIVKVLGSEIIQDNFIENSVQSIYDDLHDSDSINEFSEDHTSAIIGYQYDALKFGIPLEIIYKENVQNMKVFWNNRCVFEEYHGNLERYVPLTEWESKIDEIYEKAKARFRLKKQINELSNNKQKQSHVDAEVQRLKEKWGIA